MALMNAFKGSGVNLGPFDKTKTKTPEKTTPQLKRIGEQVKKGIFQNYGSKG